MASVDVRNLTRRPAPRFPYEEIARAALPGWELSVAYAGEARATSLNKALRGKSYAPNVLSYETGMKSGEIVICLPVAKTQAPDYGMGYRDFVAYLFIHGCLHLKGLPHGTTMEAKERALMARFISVPSSPNAATHRHRSRHRDPSDESSRRRRGN